MDIKVIDKNFCVDPAIERPDTVFYDCRDNRFEIRGVIPPQSDGESFLRMPKAVAEDKKISEGICWLNKHTAGGRVRITTDSPYVAIHAEVNAVSRMPHMPFSGSAGFDLYERKDGEERYVRTFMSMTDTVEGIWDFPDRQVRELTLNMPLYSGVKRLYIGLAADAVTQPCRPYTVEPPIVYYGSSITQGGCASRPGNSYQGFISRWLDCDYYNLGFSGNAIGDTVMADYICGLDMSVFVYDYDHNAPTPEHLAATHKPMFDKIRAAHPQLPIVMVSRPQSPKSVPPHAQEDADKRFAIIKQTYDAAVAAGDQNVWLIDGRQIMTGIAEGDGTVDGCHPNDVGFYSMATVIGAVIKEILSGKGKGR